MRDLRYIAHALRALDPPNLRRYPSVPAADELRERLRQERDDEPRGRTWAEQAADEAGQPLTGPL